MKYFDIPSMMWKLAKKSFQREWINLHFQPTKTNNFKLTFTLASGGPYCDCGY